MPSRFSASRSAAMRIGIFVAAAAPYFCRIRLLLSKRFWRRNLAKLISKTSSALLVRHCIGTNSYAQSFKNAALHHISIYMVKW